MTNEQKEKEAQLENIKRELGELIGMGLVQEIFMNGEPHYTLTEIGEQIADELELDLTPSIPVH